jgi:hypothetical protein
MNTKLKKLNICGYSNRSVGLNVCAIGIEFMPGN